MFRVPSSEFMFRVRGTVHLERRTVNQTLNTNPEHGTGNLERRYYTEDSLCPSLSFLVLR